MGFYIGLFVLFIAVTLQSSWLHSLSMSVSTGLFHQWVPAIPDVGVQISGQPGLVIMLVLAWTVHSAWEEALFWAIVGGVMQDLLAVTPLGTSVIPLVVTVFLIRSLSEQLYHFSPLLLPLFAAFATALQYGIILFVLTVISGYTLEPVDVVQQHLLPALVYNAAFILPVYIVLRRVQKRLPEPQSGF